jgi:hypothetical protein
MISTHFLKGDQIDDVCRLFRFSFGLFVPLSSNDPKLCLRDRADVSDPAFDCSCIRILCRLRFRADGRLFLFCSYPEKVPTCSNSISNQKKVVVKPH